MNIKKMTKEEALNNFIAIKYSIEQFGEVFFDESDLPLIEVIIDTLQEVTNNG